MERFAAAWSRRATSAGVPGPLHKAVRDHVLQDGGDVAVAVAIAVLELTANRAERFPFPGHRCGCELPVWITWYPRGIEIGAAMACCAEQAGSAMPVLAAHDQGLMRPGAIALKGTVAGGMAVHAARMLQHLARLLKQGDGA